MPDKSLYVTMSSILEDMNDRDKDAIKCSCACTPDIYHPLSKSLELILLNCTSCNKSSILMRSQLTNKFMISLSGNITNTYKRFWTLVTPPKSNKKEVKDLDLDLPDITEELK